MAHADPGELFTSWGFKITIDQRGSSPKADGVQGGQRSQDHGSRSSSPTWNLYFCCPFTTWFFSRCMGSWCALTLATTAASTANAVAIQQNPEAFLPKWFSVIELFELLRVTRRSLCYGKNLLLCPDQRLWCGIFISDRSQIRRRVSKQIIA